MLYSPTPGKTPNSVSGQWHCVNKEERIKGKKEEKGRKTMRVRAVKERGAVGKEI